MKTKKIIDITRYITPEHEFVIELENGNAFFVSDGVMFDHNGSIEDLHNQYAGYPSRSFSWYDAARKLQPFINDYGNRTSVRLPFPIC